MKMLPRSKKTIRKEMLHLRRAVAKDEAVKKGRAIVSRVRRLPPLQSATGILLFYPFKGEPRIDFFLEDGDKDYFFPKIVEHDLHPAKQTPETVLNSLGIREPKGPVLGAWEKVDVILVPALAIDRYGNRLGYGGGYYDRFFKRLSQRGLNPLKLGVVYSFQLIEELPTFPDDVPLDGCITENRTTFFSQP